MRRIWVCPSEQSDKHQSCTWLGMVVGGMVLSFHYGPGKKILGLCGATTGCWQGPSAASLPPFTCLRSLQGCTATWYMGSRVPLGKQTRFNHNTFLEGAPNSTWPSPHLAPLVGAVLCLVVSSCPSLAQQVPHHQVSPGKPNSL